MALGHGAGGLSDERSATGRRICADAEVLTGAGANDILAWAAQDQTRVSDPYFMQVTPEGEVAGRETIRETIRAQGPTNHPMFGKQAGNN